MASLKKWYRIIFCTTLIHCNFYSILIIFVNSSFFLLHITKTYDLMSQANGLLTGLPGSSVKHHSNHTGMTAHELILLRTPQKISWKLKISFLAVSRCFLQAFIQTNLQRSLKLKAMSTFLTFMTYMKNLLKSSNCYLTSALKQAHASWRQAQGFGSILESKSWSRCFDTIQRFVFWNLAQITRGHELSCCLWLFSSQLYNMVLSMRSKLFKKDLGVIRFVDEKDSRLTPENEAEALDLLPSIFSDSFESAHYHKRAWGLGKTRQT